MDKNENQIAENLYELRRHRNHNFPFAIYKNHFSKNKLQYISLHWHPEIEIIYIDRGSLEVVVNEKKYTLKENEAMLINSLELHGTNMIEECVWHAILFNPKIMYGFDDSIIKNKFFNNCPYHNLILDNTYAPYIKEILNSDSKSKIYEIKIIKNLFSIYENVYQNIDINLITSSSAINNFKVKKILDFINDNYNQKIKIDLLAKELGICRSEICKLFKNELHTTFTEYLTKLRIEKVIELLNSSEANITQISEIVGFNSSSYFSETFKKFYNITPLEYKYQNSNKKD